MTRAADVFRPTKPAPNSSAMLNDHNNNVHPEDFATMRACADFLARHGGGGAAEGPAWFVKCSVNIPHPAFETNATWLAAVNDSLVDVPVWIDKV